jgi:hypothetical protein
MGAARVPPLKKTCRGYFDKGTRAYRTNLVQAMRSSAREIRPGEHAGNLKLKEAKAAREKLKKIK